MTLGERLTELRKKKNLSQEEVAEKLNVTRQTVSKWELDQSTPDFDKVLPICKLYNITSEELFTGRKADVNNDNIEYNLMTDEEIKKKTAFAICSSVGLFILALVWIIIGSSISFISEEVLIGIFFIIGGIGVINLIYRLTILPDKSNKQDKIEKRERKKRIHKYDDAIAVLFTIIYLLVSFLTGAWHITWILWIVYALVCEIVHIILDKNE